MKKTDEAKNNLVYVLKERNHVYGHNPKGKCHNILQNTQMLTFSVLCSTNNISEFYSRIPYHLHNTAVIHSPLSHILPFFYVFPPYVFQWWTGCICQTHLWIALLTHLPSVKWRQHEFFKRLQCWGQKQKVWKGKGSRCTAPYSMLGEGQALGYWRQLYAKHVSAGERTLYYWIAWSLRRCDGRTRDTLLIQTGGHKIQKCCGKEGHCSQFHDAQDEAWGQGRVLC